MDRGQVRYKRCDQLEAGPATALESGEQLSV